MQATVNVRALIVEQYGYFIVSHSDQKIFILLSYTAHTHFNFSYIFYMPENIFIFFIESWFVFSTSKKEWIM